MFTPAELADIESWRTQEASKYICIWLQKFHNRYNKANKLKEEKAQCFCSKGQREPYKTSFYLWWDEIKTTLCY